MSGGTGSIATIGLSLLLIPQLAAVGAALAFAGGTLAGLVTTIAISRRLTKVSVPWKDAAVSLLIAAATGVAAALASRAMGESWVLLLTRLIGYVLYMHASGICSTIHVRFECIISNQVH